MPGSITVGVATCGRPEALKRCLGALVAGSARPGEVIVVDQAPSAETKALVGGVESFTVRYVEQERLGLSVSRNLALALASRPVLAVTDDDCAPDPAWVASIAAALSTTPAPAAVSGPVLAFETQPPGTHAISLRSSMVRVDHVGRVLPWRVGSGANFAAPCQLLRNHGGWDTRLGTGSPGKAGEDADLLYRILRAGGVVRYEPSVVVRHEWQTWERRLATRWSYGYGVGALCGIWLRRRDRFALRMLTAYAASHMRQLAVAGQHLDRGRARQHLRALVSVLPGVVYGVRATQPRPPGKGAHETMLGEPR